MKKSLFALAALGAFASAAQAQSSVTLYGILDVAVGTVSNQYGIDPTFPASVNPLNGTKATSSATGMFNGGISDSRWGLRGSEDLGGGMKANFQLESGFNAPTGQLNNGAGAIAANGGPSGVGGLLNNSANTSLDGQLFNRTAWVGLSDSNLGEIRVGRTYNFIYDTVVAFDPVQAAQLFSPIGFSGGYGGGGGVSEKVRLDNSITYKNKIGPVTVGAQYQFGGQVASLSSAGSSYGFMLGYEEGPFAVQANYFNATDAVTAAASTTIGDIALTNQNVSSYMIAAKYKITDKANVRVGYESIGLSAPSDTLNATLMPSYYGYAVSGVPSLSVQSGGTINKNVWWIGGDYNILPNLNLSVGYYNIDVPAYTNGSNAAVYDNLTQVVSGLLDYSFSKRTDVYAGISGYKLSGDYYSVSNPLMSTTNSIYAVGIRHKF